MFCSKCGKSQQEGSKFCGQCGHEFAKPISPSPTTTPKKNGFEIFCETTVRAAGDSVQSQTRSQISRAVSDVFRGIFKR
jgi:uncharacterized membrane protein YvbJ